MSEQTRKILLTAALVLVLGGIFYIESRKVEQSGDAGDSALSVSGMTAEEKAEMYDIGQEISTPDAFINVDPNPETGRASITVAGELEKGNVVLIDFWTYSCINCQRTLPYLTSWHERYGEKGLTIIGVHTPEFEFEKELVNVQRAVDQFDIEYPVVLDNDFSTWRSYKNRYWPRKYLIDIDGFIVYDRIGEGAYEATEAKIVELLEERATRLGEEVDLAMGGEPSDADEVDFDRVRTPEIYFGSSRLAYIQNLPSQSCFDSTCEFIASSDVPLNMFALGGSWEIEKEQAVLTGSTGSVLLRFSASKVNFVAEGTEGPVTIDVLLDGEQIGSITVAEPGLYNVVDLEGEYGEHLLELRIDGAGLSAFTFTFG